MGTNHYAHLAYGYDLGSNEAPQVAEVDSYGAATFDWMKKDEDGYPEEDLREAVLRRLYEAIPENERGDGGEDNAVQAHYGVEVIFHGWCSEGQESYALVADNFTVEGGESVVLDPAKLVQLVEQDQLDAKLDRALEVLAGMTPTLARGWTLLADR